MIRVHGESEWRHDNGVDGANNNVWRRGRNRRVGRGDDGGGCCGAPHTADHIPQHRVGRAAAATCGDRRQGDATTDDSLVKSISPTVAQVQQRSCAADRRPTSNINPLSAQVRSPRSQPQKTCRAFRKWKLKPANRNLVKKFSERSVFEYSFVITRFFCP